MINGGAARIVGGCCLCCAIRGRLTSDDTSCDADQRETICLGDRSMVGRLTLDQLIGVRLPVPQYIVL